MASLEDIVESLSPSGLLDRVDRLSDVPAAAALRLAADVLNPAGIDWGPGGSTGFTLASGVTVVTADSDLDVVIRAETLPPAAELMRWHDGMRLLPGRVDCQLDLPCGGLALAELVGPNPRVLLRTETGPRLVTRDALRP
jgi:phosphoribosyl-dephospho-CoA transferase